MLALPTFIAVVPHTTSTFSSVQSFLSTTELMITALTAITDQETGATTGFRSLGAAVTTEEASLFGVATLLR